MSKDTEREFFTLQTIRMDGKKIPPNEPIMLSDEKQIASLLEAKAITADPAGDDEAFKKVNINEADLDTLVSLPGLTEDMAAALIKSREREGGFNSLDQLMEVKGIGPGTVKRLRDVATVGDAE